MMRLLRLLRLFAAAMLCFPGGCAAPRPPVAPPQAPQAPQARPVEKINGITYVVRRGDTLYSIAWRSEVDFRNLARWNNLPPPHKILAGQSLRLAPPFEEERGGESAPVQPPPPPPPPSAPVVFRPPVVRAPEAEPDIRPDSPPVWRWPVRGKLVRGFGQAGNKGIDIEGKAGDPVRAAAAGKIVYSGQGLIGYGNLVIVKHSDTFLSAYGNNARLLVEEGDEVASNQPIADIGAASGSQPALHFEIRKMGKPVNPLDYLPKR